MSADAQSPLPWTTPASRTAASYASSMSAAVSNRPNTTSSPEPSRQLSEMSAPGNPPRVPARAQVACSDFGTRASAAEARSSLFTTYTITPMAITGTVATSIVRMRRPRLPGGGGGGAGRSGPGTAPTTSASRAASSAHPVKRSSGFFASAVATMSSMRLSRFGHESVTRGGGAWRWAHITETGTGSGYGLRPVRHWYRTQPRE
nr:hypothetical protein [Microbispora sp. GKU 823]